MEYDAKCNDRNYRMSSEEQQKSIERKDQFRKMEDVNLILAMPQTELLKHEYLKYRIKRLEEIYPWLEQQSRRVATIMYLKSFIVIIKWLQLVQTLNSVTCCIMTWPYRR